MPHRFRTDGLKHVVIRRPHTASHVGICYENVCLNIYPRSISHRVAFEEDPLELECQISNDEEMM